MQQRRRSPRLRSNDASRAAGPAASLPVPETPHHPRTGAALNSLIRSLDDQWQLGLGKVRQLRSPAQHQSTADKTYAKIQRLFYSARPALDDVIQSFTKVAPGFPNDARLGVLHGMLKSQTLPPSRVGTPVSARNVPPKSLLCKCVFTHARLLTGAGGRLSRSSTRFGIQTQALGLVLTFLRDAVQGTNTLKLQVPHP
jgi:hypothetical protein